MCTNRIASINHIKNEEKPANIWIFGFGVLNNVMHCVLCELRTRSPPPPPPPHTHTHTHTHRHHPPPAPPSPMPWFGGYAVEGMREYLFTLDAKNVNRDTTYPASTDWSSTMAICCHLYASVGFDEVTIVTWMINQWSRNEYMDIGKNTRDSHKYDRKKTPTETLFCQIMRRYRQYCRSAKIFFWNLVGRFDVILTWLAPG